LIIDFSGRIISLETTTTCWADELGTTQSYTRKESAKLGRNEKRDKRYSSGFNRRSEDVSLMEKWDHDKYQSQSDDEDDSRPYRSKGPRTKVKKVVSSSCSIRTSESENLGIRKKKEHQITMKHVQ
jgi:hypothetical protein